jgi:hypothetical protein
MPELSAAVITSPLCATGEVWETNLNHLPHMVMKELMWQSLSLKSTYLKEPRESPIQTNRNLYTSNSQPKDGQSLADRT